MKTTTIQKKQRPQHMGENVLILILKVLGTLERRVVFLFFF